MNCQFFQQHLFDWMELTGESSLKQEALQHKDNCSACQAEWQAHHQISSLYEHLPSQRPSDASIQRILEKAHARSFWSLGSVVDFCKHSLTHAIQRWHLAPVAVAGLALFAWLTLMTQTESPAIAQAPQVDLPQPSQTAGPFLSPAQTLPVYFRMGQDRMPSSRIQKVNKVGSVGLSAQNLEAKFNQRQQALLEADADALLMRGRRAKSMGRMDLALRDFETIYRFYPNYTYMGDVLMYRAQCYAFLGQKQKAQESLKIYQTRYPNKKSLIEPMIEQLGRE